MKWLGRLWGTPDEREGAEDLDELKSVAKRVSRRTNRIIEEYEKAERLWLQRRAT